MTEVAMHDAGVLASTVQRAAGGDEAACVRRVTEHHPAMVRAAYVIVGDAEVAREAARIAWTKAWHRLSEVKEPERVRSWLVAIAVNEARQLIRGASRRTVRELGVGRDGRPDDDPAGRIAVLDLKQAVGRLSVDDQRLLSLRFVAGLDATEIAARSGLSASGVRSRLSRCLDRLRKDLDHG